MSPSPADTNNAVEGCNSYKLRFKGIETFLRKVAFNLGNSPSQTEVKIISCVPIDVTDLQNKIISLEKQLQDAKNRKSSTKNIPVHTALIEPSVLNRNPLSCECSQVKVLEAENASMPSQCGGCCKRRKSKVSALPSCSTNELCKNKSILNVEKATNDVHRKNFFRRTKRIKPDTKIRKPKTHWVYYAHTETSPFNSYKIPVSHTLDKYPKTAINNAASSYLTKVFQRHFDPKREVGEFSDTSNFTSPACRDVQNNNNRSNESDVCSCCHGRFQNIDKYNSKNQNFITDPVSTQLSDRFNRNIYYDSNAYDVVPVKEKTNKIAKEDKSHKEFKRKVDLRCWPEKSKFHQHHYVAESHDQSKIPNSKKHKYPATILFDYPKYGNKNYKVNHAERSTDISKNCSVECIEIYAKPLNITHKTQKPETMRQIFTQNAECLTMDVDTKLAISRSIQIDINETENRTEETLNEIKSMLLSVLAEVKTVPQGSTNVPEIKLKKDAMIQKEPSQSNIQTCSSLLNSFTYNNSYDTSPNFPTCFRQIPPHLCYNISCQRHNYTHNFPLLINANKQVYGSFNNSGLTHNPIQKQVATATNEPDTNELQGKETEKLIKEIYKYITNRMDLPKTRSNTVFDDQKSMTADSPNITDSNGTSTIGVMSGVYKRDIQIETSLISLKTTTIKSTKNSLVGTESHTKLIKIEARKRNKSESTQCNMEIVETFWNKRKVVSGIIENDFEDLRSETVSESEEEDVIMGDVKVKTEKKGLIKRMLGSVKFINKIKENYRTILDQDKKYQVDDEKSESNFDYQTIYSDKTNDRRTSRKDEKRRYSSSKPIQQSPYMEQEYKRQWEESLIFQENRGRRYSSQRPFSVRQTPVYWRNYEVRNAVVDQSTP